MSIVNVVLKSAGNPRTSWEIKTNECLESGPQAACIVESFRFLLDLLSLCGRPTVVTTECLDKLLSKHAAN